MYKNALVLLYEPWFKSSDSTLPVPISIKRTKHAASFLNKVLIVLPHQRVRECDKVLTSF